jgi:hypothetical protein
VARDLLEVVVDVEEPVEKIAHAAVVAEQERKAGATDETRKITDRIASLAYSPVRV